MKISEIPVKVYEMGDRVLTPFGRATVIHDELEGIEADMNNSLLSGKSIEEVCDLVHFRTGITVRLLEKYNEFEGEEVTFHDKGEEVVFGREQLTMKKHITEIPEETKSDTGHD